MEVARKPRNRIGEPVGQMAAGGVEGDSRQHRGIHHFGSRLYIARIADRAHEIPAHALQRLGCQPVGERVGALRHGPACAARGIEPPRPRPGSQRFQRMAHAIEAARGDHTPRQCSSHFRVDQRHRRDQPPRNDSCLGVDLGQIEDRDAGGFRAGARSRRTRDMRLERARHSLPATDRRVHIRHEIGRMRRI